MFRWKVAGSAGPCFVMGISVVDGNNSVCATIAVVGDIAVVVGGVAEVFETSTVAN